MPDTSRNSPPDFSLIRQAHADMLHRDVATINEAVRRELGPPPIGGAPKQTKRKPTLPAYPRRSIDEPTLQETDNVRLKHLTTATAIAALGLAACQQENAAAQHSTSAAPRTEQAVSIPASDMQAAAALFVSDKGRDWDAYGSLAQVKWTDPAPQEVINGRYSRSGKVFLQGFSVKDIPNGRPGTEYATVKRNEGESTLSVTGTLSGVESISISKPLFSDDYLGTLRNQFGTVNVSLIADQCPAPEYQEGAGEGAFFEVSLPDKSEVFIQASQQDGGKYTDGFTVFDLTRSRPSEAIAAMNCRQVK